MLAHTHKARPTPLFITSRIGLSAHKCSRYLHWWLSALISTVTVFLCDGESHWESSWMHCPHQRYHWPVLILGPFDARGILPHTTEYHSRASCYPRSSMCPLFLAFQWPPLLSHTLAKVPKHPTSTMLPLVWPKQQLDPVSISDRSEERKKKGLRRIREWRDLQRAWSEAKKEANMSCLHEGSEHPPAVEWFVCTEPHMLRPWTHLMGPKKYSK